MNPCRRLFVALLLTALCCATQAHAGAHLRWDACYRDPGSTSNKNFACDTNTGSERLVASMFIPDTLSRITGFEFVLDFQSSSPTVPNWWQFKNAGTCRQTSVTFSTTPPPGAVYCTNPSSMVGGIGSAFSNLWGEPNRGRMTIATATAEPFSAGGYGSAEVFGFILNINHAKTVGTGNCTGCDVPMCFAIEHFKVTRPVGVGDPRYGSDRSKDTDWIATWQSPTACATFTPARNETWGAVKQMYR